MEEAKLHVDDSEVLAAIDELRLFGEAILKFPPSIADRFIRFINSRPELVRIDWATTEGTSTCILKPSDGLTDLLMALRASNLERSVVGDNIGHKESVLGKGVIGNPEPTR